MAEVAVEDGFRPPYVSFTTFENFIAGKFDGDMPPPRIDKSYLGTYSGANQAMLLSTLRTFDLIDDDGTVLPKLVEIATNEDERKRHLAERLHELYSGPAELARQNATAQQLEDWFKQFDYSGSTLRKAILFYLNAAEYAGLPTSPHFKAPRAPSNRGRSRSKTKAQPSSPPTPSNNEPSTASGERVTANFGDAGNATLIVDVQWLRLPEDVFMGLRQLTKDLQALEDAAAHDKDLVEDNEEAWS